MPKEKLFLIAGIWMAGFSVATAEEAKIFIPVPDLVPTTISYDVEGGHYQQTRRETKCDINAVSATMRMNQSHANEKWAPLVQIVLNNPVITNPPQTPDPQHQTIHLLIQSNPDGKNPFIGFIKYVGIGLVDNLPFDTPVELGKPVKVQMSWTSEGIVRATVGKGETLTLDLDQPVTSVSFIASGAQADFSDVQLGRIGSPEPDCPAKSAPN